MFQNNTVPLDFDYFVRLFEEYYLSDDPSDLGNFINGKLEYADEGTDAEDEERDPGLVDHKVKSSTSVHSMDDDINEMAAKNNKASKKAKSQSSTGDLCEDMKSSCCVVI